MNNNVISVAWIPLILLGALAMWLLDREDERKLKNEDRPDEGRSEVN